MLLGDWFIVIVLRPCYQDFDQTYLVDHSFIFYLYNCSSWIEHGELKCIFDYNYISLS